MHSRGTKLVFLELEKMAQWITTLALLIWGSAFEPPALTKRAWHKCSRLWLQYCTVETGRSWTLPGQTALPKAVSFWFSKGPCLKAKRWRWHLVFCSGLDMYRHRRSQTHLYAEYTHTCTWGHTHTHTKTPQFIRNSLYVHCSACGIWHLVCYRVKTQSQFVYWLDDFDSEVLRIASPKNLLKRVLSRAGVKWVCKHGFKYYFVTSSTIWNKAKNKPLIVRPWIHTQ